MKKHQQILGPMVAFTLVLLSSTPVLAQETHVGKIVFAGGDKLVISDVDDANEAFLVAEDAKITRNGAVVPLSDLAVGDHVKVTAMRKDGKLIATAIVAASG